jgi:predicted transcriptional regulator
LELTVTKTVTLSARIDPKIAKKLEQLQAATKRSKSHLIGEALSAYADDELAFLASIERGRADFRAGRFKPHDEVMAGLRKMLKKLK